MVSDLCSPGRRGVYTFNVGCLKKQEPIVKLEQMMNQVSIFLDIQIIKSAIILANINKTHFDISIHKTS